MVDQSVDTYLTVAELAAKFKVSTKTVYRRLRQPVNPWPCTRIGVGTNAPIRFSPHDVDAIEHMLKPRIAGQAATGGPIRLGKASRKLLAIQKRQELAA